MVSYNIAWFVSQGSRPRRLGGWVDERDERIRDVYHMLTTYYNRIVPTDVKYNL